MSSIKDFTPRCNEEILITCIQRTRQIRMAEKANYKKKYLDLCCFSTLLSKNKSINFQHFFSWHRGLVPDIISEQIIYNENLIENCVVNVCVQLRSASTEKVISLCLWVLLYFFPGKLKFKLKCDGKEKISNIKLRA